MPQPTTRAIADAGSLFMRMATLLPMTSIEQSATTEVLVMLSGISGVVKQAGTIADQSMGREDMRQCGHFPRAIRRILALRGWCLGNLLDRGSGGAGVFSESVGGRARGGSCVTGC